MNLRMSSWCSIRCGSLTAHILDSEAEESVRLKQSSVQIAIETSGSSAAQVLELPARKCSDRRDGRWDSSEFSGDEPIHSGLKNIKGHILMSW